MFTNYADVSSLVVGLGLPAVVALFSKPSTNSTVKGAAHAVLAVATGFWAVYQAHPQHFYWAPAVVAAFLAWVSGTTFYHSLLKKYSWFARLQNTLIAEAEIRLHIPSGTVEEYVEESAVVPASSNALSAEAVQQIVTALESVLRRTLPQAVADVAEVPGPTAVLSKSIDLTASAV
jgi:hypothetical protein